MTTTTRDRDQYSQEFFVAGVQFHNLHKCLDALHQKFNSEEQEVALTLEPEPTNKYDPNAVKITFDGTMIGYVPKRFSAEVSALIEMEGIENISCIITELTPSAKPWERIKVEVTENG